MTLCSCGKEASNNKGKLEDRKLVWYLGGNNIFAGDVDVESLFEGVTDSLDPAKIYSSLELTEAMLHGVYTLNNKEDDLKTVRKEIPFEEVKFKDSTSNLTILPTAVYFGAENICSSETGYKYDEFKNVDEYEVAVLELATEDKVGQTPCTYEINPELQYIPEDVDLGIMNIVRSTFEKHFEAYGIQLIKQQYSNDTTGSLVHNRTNQALLQIANLSQIDDETLFMLYATLCNRVRTHDQRAVIQNECVFKDNNAISCCGKYYSAKDNFCSECGRKLSKASDVSSIVDDDEITCSPSIDFSPQEKTKYIKFDEFGFWVESIHQVEKLLIYMEKAVEIARNEGYTIGVVRVFGGVHELDTGYESFSGKTYSSFEEAKKQLPIDFAEEEANLDGQWLNTMNFEFFTVELTKDGNHQTLTFSRGELKVPKELWEIYLSIDYHEKR